MTEVANSSSRSGFASTSSSGGPRIRLGPGLRPTLLEMKFLISVFNPSNLSVSYHGDCLVRTKAAARAAQNPCPPLSSTIPDAISGSDQGTDTRSRLEPMDAALALIENRGHDRLAAKDPKRRLTPLSHCAPVLKGAPFIVCSSCFKLLQMPTNFTIYTNTVRNLRCGSCSDVLSYSYSDLIRKKPYRDSIDVTLAKNLVFDKVEMIEKREHDQSDSRGASDNSEARDAERTPTSLGVSVHLHKGGSDSTYEVQHETKKRSKGEAGLRDAQRMLHSGGTPAQPRSSDYEEPAPIQAQAKAVDELKSYLSEIFSRFPELNLTAGSRRPRLPKQEGSYYMSRTALHSGLPARARYSATTLDHRGRSARGIKPVADKQKQPAAKDTNWRLPPLNHCRPVLEGAPFIVCPSCCELLQMPIDFTVPTSAKTVRKMRCGSCSAVLSYTYRDPARKKPYQDSVDTLLPRNRVPDQVALIENRGHDQSANRATSDCSEEKTLDELIGNFSELFSKSPELNPTAPALPPWFRRQEGDMSDVAVGLSLHARACHADAAPAAAAVDHRGNAARVVEHSQFVAAPSALSSRHYRRCRTYPSSEAYRLMEISDTRAASRVRCPRCQSVLEEPGAPVFQCGGCGTSLRKKIRTSITEVASNSFRSWSGLPPQSRHLDSSDLTGDNQLKQKGLEGSCIVLPQEKDVLHSSSDLPTSCVSQVEETHSTPHKDVMAWFASGKQRRRGLNHTCMKQAGHELLGRSDIRQKVMEKVLLGRNGGSNCSVICINGESGLGKTSLLRVLYNDQDLMDAFDERIWIQISDKLDILMLFRKIIEFSTNDHCNIMNIDLLQELVTEEIKDKKFLLFLDDADTEDQQFWRSIFEVLNTGAKGSAVVMATRSCDIAALRDVTYAYLLNPLSLENNLMILQRYSGLGTDIQSNTNLMMVAKRFISLFGANPLNLKAIGGLLCHADTISFEKFEGSVMPLQLCHDVLPINLKKCLSLCSLFPEGYIFYKQHMVLLWISHGCIMPIEGREPEDVGVEYFNELLCRSFFQYSPIHNDKDDKFVMHELIYKVVDSVSREKYFRSEDPMGSVPENILHFSLVSSEFNTIELMHKTKDLKDLQTFLVVQTEWKPNNISSHTLNLVGLDDFFLKFISLETLDLNHSDIEELPASIVGLRNLQYLSVNNTSIRVLPSELCSLSNLQTLEARNCRFLTELPGDIVKLFKLRHIDVTKELGHVHLPHGMGQLTELRTLPVFHANSNSSHCSIIELGNLHNLRGCLHLSGLESLKTGSKAQGANLKDKHRLEDLTLQWHDDGGEDIDVDDEEAGRVAEQVLESLQPHTNLQELAIRGYEGSAFPAWMQDSSCLPNLVSLTLDSCCNCAQFPAIAHLPSLKFLSVRKMYDVQRLSSSDGLIMFPSLELLNLWEMYGLEELFEASQGDCPRLRKVCISRCPDLKRLPCTPSVTELVLHCGHQLPDIPELVSLASLKIEGFHGARSFCLPAAAALPVLKKLEIRSCKELSSVEGLSALTTIQRLKIAACPKLVLP